MEQITQQAIEWLKSQKTLDACITGSCLLGYYEGQDVDLFVYNEESFNKVLWAMYYNPMFQLLDRQQKWQFNEWVDKKQSTFHKFGLVSIKFKYNLSVDVNVIYKKYRKTAFDVISSFDLDIICKAYDIKTEQTLDLSQGDGKIVHWNKWNTAYYTESVWDIKKLLRQFERCIKYYQRGYDTDLVVHKYIELLDKLIVYENIFNSVNFDNMLESMKVNGHLLREIFNEWLKHHELNEKTYELMQKTIKEL